MKTACLTHTKLFHIKTTYLISGTKFLKIFQQKWLCANAVLIFPYFIVEIYLLYFLIYIKSVHIPWKSEKLSRIIFWKIFKIFVPDVSTYLHNQFFFEPWVLSNQRGKSLVCARHVVFILFKFQKKSQKAWTPKKFLCQSLTRQHCLFYSVFLKSTTSR